MKQLFYCIAFLALFSCSNNKYKELVTNHIQTYQGTVYDLQIKYSQFDVSDLTVQDSIDILNRICESKRKEKINDIKVIVDIEKESILKYKKNLENDPDNFNLKEIEKQ